MENIAIKILFILIVFVCIVAIDLPGIIKNKEKKELVVFSICLLTGLIIIVSDQVFKIKFAEWNSWLIRITSNCNKIM